MADYITSIGTLILAIFAIFSYRKTTMIANDNIRHDILKRLSDAALEKSIQCNQIFTDTHSGKESKERIKATITELVISTEILDNFVQLFNDSSKKSIDHRAIKIVKDQFWRQLNTDLRIMISVHHKAENHEKSICLNELSKEELEARKPQLEGLGYYFREHFDQKPF